MKKYEEVATFIEHLIKSGETTFRVRGYSPNTAKVGINLALRNLRKAGIEPDVVIKTADKGKIVNVTPKKRLRILEAEELIREMMLYVENAEIFDKAFEFLGGETCQTNKRNLQNG